MKELKPVTCYFRLFLIFILLVISNSIAMSAIWQDVTPVNDAKNRQLYIDISSIKNYAEGVRYAVKVRKNSKDKVMFLQSNCSKDTACFIDTCEISEYERMSGSYIDYSIYTKPLNSCFPVLSSVFMYNAHAKACDAQTKASVGISINLNDKKTVPKPFSTYTKELRAKINKIETYNPCSLSCTLNRDGQLIFVKVNGSSTTDTECENAATNVINSLTPFSPLPPKYEQEYVNISYTFPVKKSESIVNNSFPSKTNSTPTSYSTPNYSSSGTNNVSNITEPDFGPYMKELQRRIKMNWSPPKGNESKRVVVLFSVSRDGSLLKVKVYKSSGVPASDQAAIQAVKLTAPFKVLPPEYRGDSVDIQFTFDYNVFGASRY